MSRQPNRSAMRELVAFRDAGALNPQARIPGRTIFARDVAVGATLEDRLLLARHAGVYIDERTLTDWARFFGVSRKVIEAVPFPLLVQFARHLGRHKWTPAWSPSANEILIEVTPQIMASLRHMALRGMFGVCFEDVVTRLVDAGVRDAILKGQIPNGSPSKKRRRRASA